MVINFFVDNQKIVCDRKHIAEKSQNYLACNFIFVTDDWDGFEKIVYFRNKRTGEKGEKLLDKGVCLVPASVIKSTGHIEISIWGIKDDIRITTDICGFYNYATFKNDAMSPEEELELCEQMLAKLGKKVDKTGWGANKILGTDEYGNVVEKDEPECNDILIDDTLKNYGQAADAYITGSRFTELDKEITNVKIEVGNTEALLKTI